MALLGAANSKIGSGSTNPVNQVGSTNPVNQVGSKVNDKIPEYIQEETLSTPPAEQPSPKEDPYRYVPAITASVGLPAIFAFFGGKQAANANNYARLKSQLGKLGVAFNSTTGNIESFYNQPPSIQQAVLDYTKNHPLRGNMIKPEITYENLLGMFGGRNLTPSSLYEYQMPIIYPNSNIWEEILRPLGNSETLQLSKKPFLVSQKTFDKDQARLLREFAKESFSTELAPLAKEFETRFMDFLNKNPLIGANLRKDINSKSSHLFESKLYDPSGTDQTKYFEIKNPDTFYTDLMSSNPETLKKLEKFLDIDGQGKISDLDKKELEDFYFKYFFPEYKENGVTLKPFDKATEQAIKDKVASSSSNVSPSKVNQNLLTHLFNPNNPFKSDMFTFLSTAPVGSIKPTQHYDSKNKQLIDSFILDRNWLNSEYQNQLSKLPPNLQKHFTMESFVDLLSGITDSSGKKLLDNLDSDFYINNFSNNFPIINSSTLKSNNLTPLESALMQKYNLTKTLNSGWDNYNSFIENILNGNRSITGLNPYMSKNDIDTFIGSFYR